MPSKAEPAVPGLKPMTFASAVACGLIFTHRFDRELT